MYYLKETDGQFKEIQEIKLDFRNRFCFFVDYQFANVHRLKCIQTILK